jgi:hypothetical protein
MDLGNKAMQRELENGMALDVSCFEKNSDGDYMLSEFQPGVNYCDARTEEWILSIGKSRITSTILASTTTKFNFSQDFECLYLR